MADEPKVDGVSEEELAEQDGEALPPREVMSVIDGCTFEQPVPLEETTPSEHEFDKYSI